ncbi:DHA2 family efflux MFS transporter permease subunit [Tsukamurella sp. 8F]|uniref:DHA2 family efflux MFS transporter permease subunit n=1 Tax=unclassified Tsukamurella TaxID=2633480 RepID=UPI0023B886CE|nr:MULTISPECIES: DHA2 family efflux MFS transporter permease subunit [unclassified Tsukamurella]MDF0530773.1 DHA2 family efflux MFS transporter permease subunit [Tsukamurella sp. 8J]MDF0587974.1 DHA2 family efflux MFS transporter permease subunit [Tsukamurella sp. 8F]
MHPLSNQKPAVATVYVAAMFMAVMDTTIVNVALPSLGRSFHVGSDRLGQVSIAYLVSLAVFIPASGWLGDRLGGRRALLGAIGVFTLASALCGSSATLGELVTFRILQGIGGAVMTPVGLAMLFRVYPPAERVRISSVVAMITALAPALGPVLGGVLTTYLSWQLVFLVNVPIGVATLLFGALALADHTPARPGRLDVRGLLFSGIGLGALMYGISEGPARGWASPTVIAATAVGAVLLLALIPVELGIAHPLIDIRLLRNRMFAYATALYGLASLAYFGALFLAALLFQNVMGLSAIASGLVTLPSAVGVMSGGQFVTRALYWRFGPRRITATGLLTMAVALASMAQVGPGTPLWVLCLFMFGLGIGVSFVFIPSQAASMATVAKTQTGHASSIFNAGKQLGGAVGVALLSTVLAAGNQTGATGNDLTGYHAAFLAAAAAATLAIAVALAVRDQDASTTMTSPHTAS